MCPNNRAGNTRPGSERRKGSSALDAAEHDGVYQHSLADANSPASDTEGHASLAGRSWLDKEDYSAAR
jgi:hypothetical protein